MRLTPTPNPAGGADKPRGTGGFYAVAALATAVSVDTSWRFFGEVLGITNVWERYAMFAVLELALVACGWAMRAAVRRGGKPGPARMLAWALCAMAAYMALVLSGPVAGLARVILGPVMALITLHLALGVEVRTRHGQHTGKAAQVWHELRERLLSRLGLADDDRDALARTRDRAAERAARLAVAPRATLWRRRRLARAVRISGAAIDPDRRARMLALIAASQHLDDLTATAWPSPWQTGLDHSPAGDPPQAPAPDRALTPSAPPVDATKPAKRARPKALTNAEKVARVAAKLPGATVAQIAAKAGVSESTVRRHMPDTMASPSGPHAAQTAPAPAVNGKPVELAGAGR